LHDDARGLTDRAGGSPTQAQRLDRLEDIVALLYDIVYEMAAPSAQRDLEVLLESRWEAERGLGAREGRA